MIAGQKNDNLSAMKNIKVDKDKCIGCGMCIAIAPKSFKFEDDGKVVFTSPPGDEEAKIQEAIDSCPVAAIESAD